MAKTDPEAQILDVLKTVTAKMRAAGFSVRIEYIETTNAYPGTGGALGEAIVETINLPAVTPASPIGSVLAEVVIGVVDITGAGVVIAAPAAGGIQFTKAYQTQQLDANMRMKKWTTAKEVADREIIFERPFKVEQGGVGVVFYGTTNAAGVAAATLGLKKYRIVKEA